MRKISSFIRDKISSPLATLLKQGLSPGKLALVMALGTTLSVFPVLGSTTLLCTLVAIGFRLNLPAIQFANYLAFPLQIILFFPFLKVGQAVSGITLTAITESTLISSFDAGFFSAVQNLGEYLLLACLGWMVATVPLFALVFFLFRFLLFRFDRFLPSG